MNASEQKPFFQRIWVRNGLIAGGTVILLVVVAYVISEEWLFNKYFGFFNAFLFLVSGLVAAIEKRKRDGNILTYGDAVGNSIGAFLLGFVLFTIFSILLYYVIDPGLKDAALQYMIKSARETGPMGNTSQEQFEQGLELMQRNGKVIFLFQLLVSPFIMGIIALVIYLITSIFVRKEPQY